MMRGQQEVRELALKMYHAEMGEVVDGRAADVVEEIAVAVWDAAFEAMRAVLWERNEQIAKEVQRLIKIVEIRREGKVEAGPGMPEGRDWTELRPGEQPQFLGGGWRSDG